MEKIEIATLKDVYEKVPNEALDRFLVELGQIIRQFHAMNEAAKLVIKAQTGEECTENMIEFPNSIHWTDDDKKELTVTFLGDEDAELGTLKTKLG